MNLHSALYVKKKSKVSGVGGRLYTLCWELYSFKFLRGRILGCTIIFVRTPMSGWIYLHFLC